MKMNSSSSPVIRWTAVTDFPMKLPRGIKVIRIPASRISDEYGAPVFLFSSLQPMQSSRAKQMKKMISG